MAWSKPTNHRELGNRSRDAREWAKAADAYRLHLAAHPDDGPLWVQFAHVLKEAGRIDDADGAYRTAATLMPEDADPWVHLAHMLKVNGRPGAAIQAFLEAAQRDPALDLDGEVQSQRLEIQKTSTPQEAGHRNLFSVQDLFGYLKHHTTMSGIQRVQAGIAMEVMAMEDFDAGFILTDFTGALPEGAFWLLDAGDLKRLIDYASGSRVDHPELKRMLSACEQNATAVKAGAGNNVILLGAFWGLGNTVDRYLPSKRAGARLAAYIYDIIPISHPEYCDANLVRDFSTSLSEICLVCDFMLTISDFTRITLDKFLADNGGRKIPTATVPLAHSLTGPPTSVQSWPASLQRLRGREFVAYVSTVEGRKNHAYVINVWRKLIADGVEVPDLVFVGRKGWRVSGLMDLLDGTQYLGGRVHIVHDLTDAELNAVYKESLFTIFTSFVEGWGLPVGESLMHGTPCVASSTSSIPEVGGDFVDYVDPQNVNDGVAVIGRMIQDRDYLAARRQNIAENFVPRGWAEVARTFVDQIHAHEHLPLVVATYPLLPEGAQFRPGDLASTRMALTRYVSNPTRFMIADHFYAPEHFGVWMQGKFAEIVFRTELPEGEPINVYIGLRITPWFGASTATVVLGDARQSEFSTLTGPEINEQRYFKLRGHVGAEGHCRLTIEIEGEWTMPDDDTRDFALGLSALGYARASNLQARADLLEAFTFVTASVPVRETA